MKDIIRALIKDLFKDKQYLLFAIISVLGSFILINNISSKYIDTNVPFIILFIYFLFNVITVLMPVIASLIILPISERVSGRIEFYISNNITIKNLIILYSLVSFIASFIPNFLFNILYLFCIIKKNSIILKTVFNIKYLILGILFLMIVFLVCYILTMLIFVVNRIDMLRVILTFSNVAIIYISAIPIKIIAKSGYMIEQDNILLFSIIFLIIVLSILIIISAIIKKKVNNENVILSFKQ